MHRISRRYWGWVIGALIALGIVALPLQLAAAPMNLAKVLKTGDLCSRAIDAEERRSGIPRKLLYAVAIKESGRWVKENGENIAWPWTVNAGSVGTHFSNRAEALRHVRKLKSDGRTNIDVGCMQINLHYHPKAFRTIEEGFDPAANVAYAAKFLIALKDSHGSWAEAVRHYHSGTPSKHVPYQKKVFAIWKAEQKKPDTNIDASPGTTVAKATPNPYRPATKLPDTKPSKSAKLAALKVNHEHRLLLAELRNLFPHRFGTPNRSGTPGTAAPTRFLANWPPKSYADQRRAQNRARAWAYSSRVRKPQKKLLSP